MPGNALNPKLLALFAFETHEAIQTIIQSCLMLEKQTDTMHQADLLTRILQQTHNLKGGARALGLEHIAALTHQLETLFQAMKEGGGQPETAVFDVIYQALDGIGSLSDKGVLPRGVHLDLLVERLDTAVTSIKTSSRTDAPLPEAAPRPDTVASPAQESIRVAVSRLDTIFDLVNEAQVTRLGLERNLFQINHLLENATPFAPLSPESPLAQSQFQDLYRYLETNQRQLGQLLSQLQDHVRQARMLPLSTLFNTLPPVARQLARELGKEVSLHIEGGAIQVDRAVLEQIKSPLQHLLYNSLDHGLETPEKRRAAGKPETGQITITAVQHGSSILIEMSDDGAGIDVAAIKEWAVARGLLVAEEAQQSGEQEAIWLLFQPGFSLAGAATAVSGRGVGLTIVRHAVESLHGLIFVENSYGHGVRFSLSLPVSMATSLCLLVQVNGQTFALPTRQMTHLKRVEPGWLQWEDGRLLLAIPEAEPMPALSLAHTLMANDPLPISLADLFSKPAVLIGRPEQPVALLVDNLCEVQEIVIKKLPPPLSQLPYIAGAAILGTGDVILVLSVTDLIRAAVQQH